MAETRVQLCGRLVVVIDGARLERRLPARQGRTLFAYLTTNRIRPVTRDQLAGALWPGQPPAATETALSALLSKVRRAVGRDHLSGRHELQLLLPDDALVDLEAAEEAIHRAEAAVSRGDWTAAWPASRVALHTATRGFLVGLDGRGSRRSAVASTTCVCEHSKRSRRRASGWERTSSARPSGPAAR